MMIINGFISALNFDVFARGMSLGTYRADIVILRISDENLL